MCCAIAAEVLIIEGYDEVAKEADAALQRLLELPKFEGRDWASMVTMAKHPKTKTKKRKK